MKERGLAVVVGLLNEGSVVERTIELFLIAVNGLDLSCCAVRTKNGLAGGRERLALGVVL